jgi:hypothetical protein
LTTVLLLTFSDQNDFSVIVFQINNLAKNIHGLANLEGFGLKDFSGIL